MPSIKENIQEVLLEKIAEERQRLMKRKPLSYNEHCELYQIGCEERFLNKLEELIKSL